VNKAVNKTVNQKTDTPPTTFSAHITGLSHEGRGITHIDGKTVFMSGALPEEGVTGMFTKRRSRFDEAKAVEIVTPSPDRVKPKCPHFEICGGCSLQHLSPAAQVAHKQHMVLEQLQHFGGVVPKTVVPAIVGPAWGYRRKARLGVKYVTKKDAVLVGFREKQSHWLADLQGCEILEPIIGRNIQTLRTLIRGLDAYQTIPQIEVAVGDTEAALVFRHLEPLSAEDKQRLIAFGQAQGIHTYLQPGGLHSVHKLWPTEGADRLSYQLPDFELNFSFHPNDFVQVNRQVNVQLVNQAVNWLDLASTDRVLDLFCGLGNFTLPMARAAQQVVGIEGADTMIKRAEENARSNRLENVSFYMGDLFSDQTAAPWAKLPYDKILLDPPRSGAIELLPVLGKIGASTIVYVSCNPATLARDVGELHRQYGYELVRLGVVDMFPHTTHVESMALLVR